MKEADRKRLDLMSMNELRAMLYEAGVEYPDEATRRELINLILEKV